MQLPISVDQELIAEFCRQNGIRRLALFGSVLRPDFGPESDIDVLVEFLPDARVGFFKLADLEDELSGMLGRSVDLNTPASISKYFRDAVLDEVAELYEAA